jgi:hypothetical protein
LLFKALRFHQYPVYLKLLLERGSSLRSSLLKFPELSSSWSHRYPRSRDYPNRIELVFHTENSMKYRSLHTILKYRFNIPNLIFHVQNIGISYRNGMLKRYLRIVCKDRYFILFQYEILIQFQMGITEWNKLEIAHRQCTDVNKFR